MFPLHTGVHKKGDASKETIESAKAKDQNLNPHVIDRPNLKLREKRAKISDGLKKQKVYHTLRKARVDKYYKGKREAALKKKSEEGQAGAPVASAD